jgi:beta-lactamase superfamily II metal-dependent hydrolase
LILSSVWYIVKKDGMRRGGRTMRFKASVRAVILGLLIGFVGFQGCADKDTSVYEPDLVPPYLPSVSEDRGRIEWTTNEDCFCLLIYGTAEGSYDHYCYNVYDGGRDHYVDLIDAEPGEYYLRILATDLAGNSSTSEELMFYVSAAPETENLIYTMVDVGWGDCHFLEFPGGTNVMVDAGSDGSTGYDHKGDVDAFLFARGVARPSGIDYMIATHAHVDHYGGFPGNLIPRYYDTYFLAPEAASQSVWPYVERDLDEKNVPSAGLSEGQTNLNTDFLKWDEEHDIEVKVLSSGAGRFFTEGQEGSPINCDSPVIKVSYGEVDILLTGDAEEFVEQRMIKTYGKELDCEILKVGHHGNNDATSEEFLEWVSPRVGLIPNSLEENDGVFDQSVINLLRDYSVDYFVSDRAYMNAGRSDDPKHGNITVITDGGTFIVSAWK